MKILVTYPLSPRLVQSGLGDLVVYRPELADQPEDALRHALSQHLPGAVLVNGICPSRETLAAWRDQGRRPVRWIRCHPCDPESTRELSGIDVERVEGTAGNLTDDLQALGLAERHLMERAAAERLAACGVSAESTESLSGSRVTLVGAGIVNLMTALDLVDQGADVEVLEASRDPRGQPDWRDLGATHGGGNARLFCFTEADCYNARMHSETPHIAQSDRKEVFRRGVTDGGWLAVQPGALDPQERAWIENFYHLPRWRAEVFTEDIHGFNIASHARWQQLRRETPHLFEGVGYNSGVLRLYAQAPKAAAAEALHARLGSLVRALDGAELSERHPACRDAVASGQIVRALEVRGFSLTIHDFVAKLLASLEERGVRFRWRQRVTAVEKAADGGVTGLRVQDFEGNSEQVVRSPHYVLSPGAYGHSLLENTRSVGKIQGILGLWLELPNLEPRLCHPLKIHRPGHVGEDSNVTLATDGEGRPTLVLGSGFGFLGSRSLDMASPEIATLFAALEETAQRFFPHPYRQAVGSDMLVTSRKACVRPFTSTGLGIFEVAATVDGGRMVIASGHNTGGFTQAPAVADAVAATLSGRSHTMQTLYDPERGIRPDRRVG